MAGNNDSAYQYPYNYPINACFIVRNKITDSNKTIQIFNYPIPVGYYRDLIRIPGISEADIRASLLKGTLRNKIFAGEIEVVCSDIDLLQFNGLQKVFLQNAGIVNGLAITGDQSAVTKREDIQLLGTVDDVNTIYTIPDSSFIYDGFYKIIVYRNGVKQHLPDDFTIFESGGPGTGYDGIIMTTPPTTNPPPDDIITADYYILNT